MDKKTISGGALLVLLGSLAGAGVMHATSPSMTSTAVAQELVIGPDGATGLHVVSAANIGGPRMLVLNWSPQGDYPLIQGQTFDNADARAIGQAAAVFVGVVQTHLSSMSDALAAWQPTVADLAQLHDGGTK